MLKDNGDGTFSIVAPYSFEKPKPLHNDEIHELANEYLRTQNQDGCLVVLGLEDFARAIEERHGIK